MANVTGQLGQGPFHIDRRMQQQQQQQPNLGGRTVNSCNCPMATKWGAGALALTALVLGTLALLCYLGVGNLDVVSSIGNLKDIALISFVGSFVAAGTIFAVLTAIACSKNSADKGNQGRTV